MEKDLRDYFNKARTHMVYGQIHPCGVMDESILHAFLEVPREDYVTDALRPIAYAEMAHKLPNGDVMMTGSLLGRLIQLANIDAQSHVLSVGPTYSHAILACLTPNVNNCEPYDVVLLSNGMLIDARFNDTDLYIPPILEPLLAQLKVGGSLIFVAGPTPHYGWAYSLLKLDSGRLSVTRHFNATTMSLSQALKL